MCCTIFKGGFSMFKAKQNERRLICAFPYQKDVLKEVKNKAEHKLGFKITGKDIQYGFYYSQQKQIKYLNIEENEKEIENLRNQDLLSYYPGTGIAEKTFSEDLNGKKKTTESTLTKLSDFFSVILEDNINLKNMILAKELKSDKSMRTEALRNATDTLSYNLGLDIMNLLDFVPISAIDFKKMFTLMILTSKGYQPHPTFLGETDVQDEDVKLSRIANTYNHYTDGNGMSFKNVKDPTFSNYDGIQIRTSAHHKKLLTDEEFVQLTQLLNNCINETIKNFLVERENE